MIPDISTITKDEIAQLSIEEFPGRIIVVDTVKDADKAVQYLSMFPMIGFDTETRPSFKKGMRYKVALMQLSTEEVCFLFRLNRVGFPASLKEFLTSGQHMKIGLSLRDDFCAIRRSADVQLENFVDLQQMVREYGIEDSSLQKIYAILFGKRITKGQQLSNWEADVLTDAQKRYAALDAWACLKIYNRLKED
ncbi:MAG: 3'-5' exonuclease domain-containing protein 2 [Tannerellaceae bacterium]|nr:3'-5' exonuclease domain-containing protein 2 [Tannerellaceae bacterium]